VTQLARGVDRSETIRFSVVIPLHNARDAIVTCLDSVLRQSRLPDEIIVVNDGSTDGGQFVARQRFGDKIVLVHQENRGVSAARNAGIRIARNEFVCLLDADDEWAPEYLAEIEALILRFPRAQLFSAGFTFDDDGRRTKASSGVAGDFFGELDFLKAYSRALGIVSSSSVCIRKSNFDKGIVFPEGSRCGEDIYYWIRLGLLGPLAFSAKRMVVINREEEAETFRSRVGEMPCYIEWIVAELPTVPNPAHRRYLRRIVWEHSLKSGLLAVEFGKKRYLSRLYRALRNRQSLLSVAVAMLYLVPGWSIRIAREHRRRLATVPVGNPRLANSNES
jgi:glycosyltransferase involved in cell wall biosynthesis